MSVIAETSHYKLYWYDNEKTILIGEVRAGWTWTAAYDGIELMNEALGKRASEIDVYSIIHLQSGAQMLPKSGSIITNLRNLLRNDPHHEKLTIYVVQSSLLYNMIQIAGKLYGLRRTIDRYHFVTTLDEALLLVKDKTASNP